MAGHHVTIMNKMVKTSIGCMIAFFILMTSLSGHASESVCAQVKIEIKQELTLERQAFDAHMRINNGLTTAAIKDIAIDVRFSDENGDPVLAGTDPNNPNALFFIRVDTMENISNITGSGQVAPKSSADIHWLIIPAPGASNGLEQGTLYNVGATLTYTLGGEENITEVTPDYIFVKPMPELTLDYFIPSRVYADDPFTSAIEPSTPFTLGVRVKNNGAGSAHRLKIDSAQPKIVENEQGLLINFFIEGCEVNGQPFQKTLLADFGTIESKASGMARWIMTCTLSGRFVDFSASFSHADELGGELTSLIQDVNTHFLAKDVLVDLSGRDNIEDFLAVSDTSYKVYESDSTESDVSNQSGASTLTFKSSSGQESTYSLSIPPVAGFVVVSLPDPHQGSKILKQAIRSDNKIIKPENVWLSKIQNAQNHTWSHFINLFDVNNTDSYTLIFDSMATVPQAPALQTIADKSVIENQQVSFIVEASDPNGTIPALTITPLPAGAQFTDEKTGTGIFDWTPAVGQKGEYLLSCTASDGSLAHTRHFYIRVFDIGDTDMDGMLDSWEMAHFGTLARDGSQDFDQDGISDLQEFLDGTDPTLDESVPSIPVPLYPDPDTDVTEATPELVVENSTDAQNQPIDYEFEVFSDPQMTSKVTGRTQVPKTEAQNSLPVVRQMSQPKAFDQPVSTVTGWTLPVSLPDNARYYWRVRSFNPDGSSLWAYGEFFVNTQNDAPGPFGIASPTDGTETDTPLPTLSVTNSVDPDNDRITYTFKLYTISDPDTPVLVSPPVVENISGTTSWVVHSPLDDHTLYFWQVTATDEKGAVTLSEVASFYVNTANHAPSPPVILEPIPRVDVETFHPVLQIQNSTDPDNDPVSYFFEIDTCPTFDSPDRQIFLPVTQAFPATTWQVSNLDDNTGYYWRVKASDGKAHSEWTLSRFFINTMNEAPQVPTIQNPGSNAWVSGQTPVLSVRPGTDPDLDALEYIFEVYSNPALTRLVARGTCPSPEWTLPVPLKNNTTCYWRARTLDEHGVKSAWTAASDFFVKLNIENIPPQITIKTPVTDVLTHAHTIDIQWEDSDPDDNAMIYLYYDTKNSGQGGTLISGPIHEDPDGDGDTFSWDISSLEDGTWYLYAVIEDADTRVVHYSPAAITIDRTPPVIYVSPAGGSFNQTQHVTLAPDEPCTISYTLDGSDPDDTGSLYSGPIEISTDTLLKYRAVDTAGNTTEILSQEYTFESTYITLHVATNKGFGLENIPVYVFRESGTYTGQTAKTNAAGNAAFNPENFAANTYKFRIDYSGHQFWTDPVFLPDTRYIDHVIPVETVVVNLSTANGPATESRVYLFSETGTYLGYYRETDANGQAVFELPAGIHFKFRADLLGSQYWTPATQITGGSTNTIDLDTGGGLLQATLQKDPDTPIPGIRMYLFSHDNRYLGRYQTTDDNGQVSFEVSGGEYKLRADYLGDHFWTEITPVTTDTAIELTLPHKDIRITVSGIYQDTAEPLEGVKVYLFSIKQNYLGRYAHTDLDGQVSFSLPEKPYKVRVDYMNQQFWSDEFEFEDTRVDITMAKPLISVTGFGLPQNNLKIYLFSDSGIYLNQYKQTTDLGQVQFTVPEGTYKFRLDHGQNQYWSPASILAGNMVTPVTISVGGGRFDFTLKQGDNTPIPGVKCYVFNENKTYIGLQGTTDENGRVSFDLAEGTFLIRTDYLGRQFWTDPLPVPGILSADMVLPHETVRVRVETTHQPAENARVYLFSEIHTYLGQYQKTDTDGLALFTLPTDCRFTFRADVLGNQYFSDVVLIQDMADQPVNMNIGGGLLSVTLETDDQTPLPDIRLYLFSDTGQYLGKYLKTDAMGQTAFDVSHGSYKIRADYMGYPFWSNAVTVSQDTDICITLPHKDIDIDIQKSFQGILAPLKDIRVYLFTSNRTYTGFYKKTDAFGKTRFSLPDNTYIVRADYMRSSFWSDIFQFTNPAFIIPHGEIRIHLLNAGQAVSGARVYLFNDTGQYLDINTITDENGWAVFQVPADRFYKFKTTTPGRVFWSSDIQAIADQIINTEMEITP